jgi:hypothetical protein
MVISANTYVQEFCRGNTKWDIEAYGRILLNWILGFCEHHVEISFTEGKQFLDRMRYRQFVG